jgi:acyl transferase domain-containing protein/acyl carrier protein
LLSRCSLDTPARTPPPPPAEPLAIIGIGCLFPGSGDFAGFWSGIVNKIDAVRDVPPSHWRAEDYLDPDPKAADHVYAARGGFLDPVAFSPAAFGVPPTNLEATDTSQLLGLVVAQQALEDCGYRVTGGEGGAKTIDRRRVGVILGVTGTLELVIPLGARLGHPVWRRALHDAGVAPEVADDVVRRIADSYVGWQENSFPGLLGNVVAGRIANRFDLGGTNCVVDAACASSLGAVHLAAMELAARRADVVLTGGVDTFNDIFMFTCFSKTPALSPTGNARPFDAAGDGTVLGEGLGMVVLKRLADARRDGDRVYAVLRGMGTSSDGKGNAVYAPRKEGQVEALRSAYRDAGVTPDTVELVEAHGTGTRVGDATEVSALAEVYRADGNGRAGPWCALGSIKSQLGHTKAAAGAAGLLKAAAALYHKVLPPTIKVEKPLESLEGSPFYVNTEKRPWLAAAGHPRRAAVSAFGFGGSNFHCVLEEADPHKPGIDWAGEVQVVALAAESVGALKDEIARWPAGEAWDDLCRRADQSRRQWRADAPFRLLLVLAREKPPPGDFAARVAQMLDQSAGKPFSRPAEGVYFGAGPPAGTLAVLFPGQGAQYPGMLRDLACHFPAAQAVLASADGSFGEKDGLRLVDFVYPRPAFTAAGRAAHEEALRETDVAQPALGAVSLGAWRVLEGFGVRADAFAGHSYGELTALCAAGRLAEDDFHALSLLRGRLMARAGAAGDAGGMLAVKAREEQIVQALREERIDLVLANKNAPEQTVLSGPAEALDRAAEAFRRRKTTAVRLPVAAAFHSPRVESARAPFLEALGRVRLAAGRTPVHANSTAQRYPDEEQPARELLGNQLARPVLWVGQVEALHAAGVRNFLEVGPGGRLTGLVEAILPGRGAAAHALDPSGAAGKNGFFDLAGCLAWLAARGCAVDLAAWAPAPPAPARKPAHTVPLTGANYVKPRAPLPPRVPSPPPAANGNHLMSHPTPPEPYRPSPPAPPAVDASGVSRALEVTRESLAALQKMQEQTAQLHRQFLDGQEHAHRTVHLLVEQQHRLLQASLGLALPPPPDAPVEAVQDRASRERERPEVLASRERERPEAVEELRSLTLPARQETRSIPAPVAPPAPPPAPALPTGKAALGRVEHVLLEVIAEKTGYPAEALGLGMALDADLGIDSIKRVEILSALQERLPEAPAVKPEHLGSLHTLGDIAAFLADAPEPAAALHGGSNGHAAPPAPGRALAAERVQGVLLEVIAEKTGYPAEALGLGMALDADLGIDSIKRVEILSALQERLPEAPAVKPEHLGSLHTLGDIAAFLADAPAPKPAPPPAPARPPAPAMPAALERSVVGPAPLPPARADAPLPAGAEVWLCADDPALAGALRDRLASAGLRPRLAACAELARSAAPGTLGALVVVAPPGLIADGWLRDAVLAVKQAGPALRRAAGVLLTVARMDGAFGFSAAAPRREPLDGGLAGLAKTVRHEWPEVRARAVDVDGALDPAAAAAAVAGELFASGPAEVGVSGQGRVTLERAVRPLTGGEGRLPLAPGDVVVVSGGARGVTAEAAVALARHYRPTLVLLGRSPAPGPEPDGLAGLADEPALARELLRRDPAAAPRAAAEQARSLLAAREIRRALARIREAGAQVVYHSADVRDAAPVAALLSEVRRTFGPVRGLVHGAGVLADAKIEAKTAEQFDAVYGVKVGGLRSLLAAVGDDDLKALVLFSSSTARFGRAGQVDYAVANEVLNKLAWQEAARRPGCRTVALNWGPWDGGMVRPAHKALFAQEGVGVIPLSDGAELLAGELLVLPPGPREVVVLAAGGAAPEAGPLLPAALPAAFERVLDPADFPVLASHVLDGRPVLPLALMLEWLAHAALVQNPGYGFHGCDDLRVLQGVTLEGGRPLVLRVNAGKAARRENLFVAPAELRSRREDGREVLHARAELVLASSLPPAPPPAELPVLPAYPHTPREVYDGGMLFHGPDLQGIEQIDGCGEGGIAGVVRSAPAPAHWLRQPLRQHWLTDPLVVDGSFQLMILWSLARRGAASLPCHARRYRQYRRAFPTNGVRVAVRVGRATDLHALADIDFVDRDGRLIARLEGYECVIDPALRRAFGAARPADPSPVTLQDPSR